MKRIHMLALGAFAALGLFTVSCDGGVGSQKAVLKTSNDSLSYAYGVKLSEGLDQYLISVNIIQDTAAVRMNYSQMIAAEADAAKKDLLQKEFTTKLDSINKANSTNMAKFLKGMNESFMAADNESPYFQGIQIGERLKQMTKEVENQPFFADSKEKLNKSLFITGLLNSVQKETLALTNAAELTTAKEQAARDAAQAKQDEALKQQYAAKVDSAHIYMDENKTKAGILTLPGGVQYKVIKEGTGAKPTATNQVKVFYRGTLTNGTEFDSNMGKEPATFGVGQVIKGWQEALQAMPVGSKWLIYIPFEQGYGFQGSGPIPPCANLIFEVELLDIVQ